jgi:hypothetical protein
VSDCEVPEFYAERLVVARKPHRCCETRREIPRGERYYRISAKWDGEVHTYAQSEAAYHFARWLNGYRDGVRAIGREDDCIEFGGIGEHVAEVNDPELAAEWARVCKGEITRWTLGTPRPEAVASV